MSRAGFSSCPFSDLRGEEATHGPESAVPAPPGGWASAGLREETHPAAWPIPAALAQNAACGGHFVCIYGTDYRIILCLCPCSVPSSGHRTETHRGAVSVVGTWGRHPGEGCCPHPPGRWLLASDTHCVDLVSPGQTVTAHAGWPGCLTQDSQPAWTWP